MKKIILLFVFLAGTVSLFSQTIPNSIQIKNDYITTSRHQRTAGWVMLGSGVGLAGIGTLVSMWEGLGCALDDNGCSHPGHVGIVIGLVGVASALGSIPLFISASHNKARAARIGFSMQKLPMNITANTRTAALQSGVTLKISL